MRSQSVFLVAVLIASVGCLVLPTESLAGRCSGISPVLFCDDFDRWCADPDAPPSDACEFGTPSDPVAFAAFWPQDGTCSPNHPYSLTTTDMWKPDGYAVQVPQNQDIEKLVRHGHDMSQEILAHPDNTIGGGSANGSGVILPRSDPSYVDPSDRALMPDVLKGQFFVHGSSVHAYGYMSVYLELSLGDDRAPLNFRKTHCYPQAQGPFEIIQPTDNDTHASFAFGLLAKLDQNPCGNGNDRRPQQWRAVVYDGLRWTQLKAPAFGLPLPDVADFRVGRNYNLFYYFIGTDYIEIRLNNEDSATACNAGNLPADQCVFEDVECIASACADGPDQGNLCSINDDCRDKLTDHFFAIRVPREYKGPFNKVSMGVSQGLDVGAGECLGPAGFEVCYGGLNDGNSCATADDCPPYAGDCVVDTCVGGTSHGNSCTLPEHCPDAANTPVCLDAPPISNNAKMEEVVLYDGIFEVQNGACCLPDSSCTQTDQDNCENTLGGTYNGDFTLCQDVQCCPVPFANADALTGDTDVDQRDFAAFQGCLGETAPFSASCECFDQNKAGSSTDVIDGDDFTEFKNCATGPDVPFDDQNPPLNCNP